MASEVARSTSGSMPGSFGGRYSLSKQLSRENDSSSAARESQQQRRTSQPERRESQPEKQNVTSPTAPSGPPSAPSPSQDKGLAPDIDLAALTLEEIKSPSLDADLSNINAVEPVIAMKLLARGVQALATLSGDIPATPPIMVQSDKIRAPVTPTKASSSHRRTFSRPGTPLPNPDVQQKTSFEYVGPPEAQPGEFSAGDDISEPQPLQTMTIVRKFYCKVPPPISLEAYLMRMHKFCPMSPAVYLAAAVYIQKLCIEDRVVPATARTVHRLLLASLRVAMKALEDLRYSQERFAFVGGVKQEELRNLEVSLCYLLDFKLQVTAAQLQDKMNGLLDAAKLTSGHSKRPMRLDLPFQRLPS